MESQYTGDDLDIKIDVNPKNSRSFELNNINNIGVSTSSSINIHNIDVGTSSSTNKPVDDNDLDEYLRNNKEDEDNKVDFSLHETPINYLF
jgi:hypothetical protein